MITPSFVNVSGGEIGAAMDIDKMLVINGATADSQCYINVMDKDGIWIGTYYWMLESTVGGVYYPAGWCDANYISDSDNWKSFGPEPVPEPTSGLLLLLGVAGLALKRRRA